MKFAFYLLPVLVACVIARAASGQVFSHFSDREGAPETTVWSIAQDKQGFMWFASTQGLYRYDSRTFFKYRHDRKDSGSISSEYTEKVYVDRMGRLWVTNDAGLSLYNAKKDSFTLLRHNPEDPSSMPRYNRVKGFTEDRKNNLWVATSFGINRITFKGDSVRVIRELTDIPHRLQCIVADPHDGLWVGTTNGLLRVKGRKAEIVPHTMAPQQAIPFDVRDAHVDTRGVLWLATNQGLFKLDTATERYHKVQGVQREGESPAVNQIVTDQHGQMWLATTMGLVCFTPETDQVKWYIQEKYNPNSLVENSLKAVFIDRQRAIWLGSNSRGISYLNTNLPNFSRWQAASDATLGQTPKGRLWTLSKNTISLFGPDDTAVSINLKLPDESLYHSPFLDDTHTLWFAGIDNSLTSYDLKTGKQLRHPINKILNGSILPGMSINMIYADKRGRVWLSGNLLGLVRFDPRLGQFERVSTDLVASITEDSKGNLWFAGMYNIHVLPAGSSKPEIVKVNGATKPTEVILVRRIEEDPSGRIWAIYDYGLLRYDRKRQDFLPHNDDSPELLNYPESLQIDAHGYLWMGSRNKLICYRPDQKLVQAYDYRDGLPAETNLETSYKDGKGNLYFPTGQGTFRLSPDKIASDTTSTPLALVSLKLFNKVVKSGDQSALLVNAIGTTQELTFRHDQNVFTIDFTLLSYVRSDMNRYAYFLENFEKDWNYVQTPSATYTNLPAGTYTFLAKAINGNGYWSKEPLRLKITVLPPWWGTWYAYLGYLLLTAGLVYAITRFLWLRSVFRRENALNQIKIDFFTNVSHEIRTHLSLISGPLQKAFQQAHQGQNNAHMLTYARNNSDRLMLLVNELLDFRKMQSNGIRLQVQQYDVVRTLKSVVAAFEHQASEKAIETIVLCPDTPVPLWFDIAQMQKVFYNLLSNAYKFTPDGGRVTVQVSQTANEVIILVKDTGKGISKHHLQNLFTYYYQADSDKPGYGIGLALSKSIVEQHHGSLSAQSQLASESTTGGTVLTIRMRQGNHYSLDQLAGTSPDPMGIRVAGTMAMPINREISTSSRRNTLLIIEDNDQLRVFIRELFEEEFNTLEAGDGLRGLELANEHIPDIILCDVMMPGLNGLEVCKRLKNADTTAHIPVILLTARTQNDQILEGLATGPDDYLIKPFDPRILSLKISNLIHQREELKKHYRRSLKWENESESATGNNINEAFLAKIKKQVIDNLINVDFGVDELAIQAGMSVSVLYRKMRALTGQTVNEFIKDIRLSEARKLLISGGYHVNEVATLVGFEDSKYFSKEFRKAFGSSPSEIKNHPGR